MAVTDFFAGEIATELLKQLVMISAKAWRYKNTAKQLLELIETIQPTVKEIQYSGVELPPHRQTQIRMLFESLEKGKKLTDKVLGSHRWNLYRQLTLARKMEKLEKTISNFLKAGIHTHILADVHLLRVNSDVRFDRVDKSLERMIEQVGSMKIGGGGLIRDAMKRAEATMEIETNDDSEKFGVGLELGKRKVKKMMFEAQGGVFGISGMGGVGKTTLAKELERDDQVRCHFENRILFLTVSQSPMLEELRTHIWGFLTGCETINPVTNLNFEFEGGVRMPKLVILDDVWTREALEHLTRKMPGCTTLVVSRSKLTEPKSTYDVEVLSEDEAISLFCLCAFGQKSVPSGFCSNLVKQVANECKGLPLALKVTGASLKDRPEKYWEGALQRLSKGEPADETHETRLLHQMEASLEYLDQTTKECFLDLGAFPEDRKIPLDVLINMWIELHDIEEGNAFAILVDLSDKNLLTLGKDPRLGSLYASHYDIFVTQHDVLRDLALHLCNRGKVNRRQRLLMPKRESVLPREWERNSDEQYDAQIVSIHTGELNEMDWFDMMFPKAEILILIFSSDKYVLPPFITKMSRLRVLVIINNGMSPAVLHDFSLFANLSKLRSLWLERVHVPELSNTTIPLKNLHKMSLILCKINNSFDQTGVDVSDIFPNLGDLTIDHCDDLVALPSSICGLTSLNSLSITNCPRLSELPKNLSRLRGLELLRLYACPELKALPEEICELSRLKYLDISQCVSLSCLPEKIGKLTRLEKIDMRECCFSGRPSSAVSLKSLRHVICDTDVAFMWDEVKRAVPGLKIEAAEKCFSLDWLDE
ncbi:PREDICTED: probable disease resistance protein At4g33300 [Camelina sativa]|uniref:Probable disease resistance protein At4g33300 n=1 Tax=Camelina sativa TaxID=90675 RepID=A0ABM0U964_CAMSA|nr:PREDICTED: probable disease resistance protein At4g33300 [Camelina sativa]